MLVYAMVLTPYLAIASSFALIAAVAAIICSQPARLRATGFAM